jgi:monothiol glutaredoxin
MEKSTKDDIENHINTNDVMLFMKGTPEMPQCGFSAAVTGVLNHLNIDYGSVNVLENNEIREGIKEFTNWPTIPQLYVKGEFIGGCDIVREMFETGELKELLVEKDIIDKS